MEKKENPSKRNGVDAGKPEAVKIPVSTFSKEQLLKAQRYREQRDALSVLLQDGRQYSHADVEGLIDKFMKGRAK